MRLFLNRQQARTQLGVIHRHRQHCCAERLRHRASAYPLPFRSAATWDMPSALEPFSNASAVFTVAATGTTTDARTGNVVPNTTTVSVALYLRQGSTDPNSGFPGVDTDVELFEGYAVNPQALDARIRPGTTGTLTFAGEAPARCEVLNARYPLGSTGFIGATVQGVLGDRIRLQRFVNG